MQKKELKNTYIFNPRLNLINITQSEICTVVIVCRVFEWKWSYGSTTLKIKSNLKFSKELPRGSANILHLRQMTLENTFEGVYY